MVDIKKTTKDDKKMYVHLYINDELITAFEYDTTFYGELAATIDLIAYEQKVDPKDIKIEIKERGF